MENQIICPKCGTAADDGSVFCAKCGSRLDEKIFCRECGKEVKPGSQFCQGCGAPLSKNAEKALKSAAKDNTDASNPIIVTGKERTKSRKISDMLLFIATALLIIVPFFSVVKFTSIAVYNFYFYLGGEAIAAPSGYLWSIIQLLSSIGNLDGSIQNIALSVLAVPFSIFLIFYFLVISIVSFVSLIKSIIKFARGESYAITGLTLKALSRVLTLFVFISILSTNAFGVVASPIMKMTLFLASALIIASAVLSFVANRKAVFLSAKDGFGAIATLAFFAISLLSAVLFVNYKAYQYIGIIFRAATGNESDFIVLAAVASFPALIFSFFALVKNLSNMKSSFKSAVFLNYTSRNERAYHRRAQIKHLPCVSYMVIATIYLFFSISLASIGFLGNIEAIEWIISNFADYDFMEALSYLLRAIFEPFEIYISFPLMIWELSVLSVVANGVTKSLAKKKIAKATKEAQESENSFASLPETTSVEPNDTENESDNATIISAE